MKPSTLLLATGALIAQSVLADVQVIEPDDYAANAEIIFPGVTLEMRNYQIPFTSLVTSVELGPDYASTGVRNFGGGFHGGQQFVALFAMPIAYFAIDIVNDDMGLGSDSALLAAYDQEGNTIGFSDWITVPAEPWPAYRTVSISGNGIARVEVISDEWIQLDNLRFSVSPIVTPVPEPGTLAFFALGLGLLGLRLGHRLFG